MLPLVRKEKEYFSTIYTTQVTNEIQKRFFPGKIRSSHSNSYRIATSTFSVQLYPLLIEFNLCFNIKSTLIFFLHISHFYLLSLSIALCSSSPPPPSRIYKLLTRYNYKDWRIRCMYIETE